MVHDLPPTTPVWYGHDVLAVCAVEPGLAIAIENRFAKPEADVTNTVGIPAETVT